MRSPTIGPRQTVGIGGLASRSSFPMLVLSMLLLAGPAASPVAAQEPTGLQAAAAIEQLLVRSIAQAEASVVSIARFSRAPGEVGGFQPELIPRPGFNQFGEQMATPPSSPDFVPNEFATGVIVDKSGLIVTNYHAVEGEGEIWISTIARRPMRAEIRGADPRSDLAVLRVINPPTDVEFKPVMFGDPTQLKKGQIVIALGNPYAIARDGEVSASWGIIANLSRKAGPSGAAGDDARDRKNTLHHFGTLIQTDAKLNLGTSGGALLNLKGEMIGLTTSQAAVAGFEQAAGYAIPCDEVFRRVVDALKQGKEVDYGLLGIQLRALMPGELATGLRGVRVDNIVPGSPAEASGIARGDIITQVAGKPIADVDGLMLQVGRQPAAADTTITLDRDGRTFQVPVTLAKYEVRGKKIITAPEPTWRGLTIDFPSAHQQLNPQMNMQFPIPMAPAGPAVLTIEVEQDSPAWKAGLRRGMLITHVRNVPVSTPKEFQAQVAVLKGDVELRIGATAGQPPVVKVPAN